MKTLNNVRTAPVLLALALVAILAVPAIAVAAQAEVQLGKTSSFAVLAGQTITNTGPTTITGDAGVDVGLSPGAEPIATFPGQADVTLDGIGAVHLQDAVALQAQLDLKAAYNDAAGRTPFTTITSELGGKTLKPGVYVSETGPFEITGTLTLDAQGDPNAVFIFKSASSLITAADSNVNPINGARYCRVFWQVTSSATLGTNSNLVGHVFALTSITAEHGASIQGQLLARNGSVTLDNNIINNGLCPTRQAPAPTPTENGGELPTTSTPWYDLLLAGVVLALVGIAGYAATTRRIHE